MTDKPRSNADKIEVIDMPTDISATGSVIWQLVDKWMVEHQGERFDLDIICRQLDIKERKGRHHVSKKLSYEVQRGNLEKTDKLFRTLDKEVALIDWTNPIEVPPLGILWPYGVDDNSIFGFARHVLISPGDIVVVAGVSNMGKTGFILNLLWNNMDTHSCTLMGNEYEAGKFHRRVANMTWANPINGNGEPKFELVKRYENYHDIIRPDNINIIDWISLSDNFYAIGKIIDRIQSKLRGGIAVVVLQKESYKELGIGGGFSRHLASLYLTIDFGRLAVVKAKEHYGEDPNGKIYGFDLYAQGCKFGRIREVLKCKGCGGAGKTFRGACTLCDGQGYVNASKRDE